MDGWVQLAHDLIRLVSAICQVISRIISLPRRLKHLMMLDFNVRNT